VHGGGTQMNRVKLGGRLLVVGAVAIVIMLLEGSHAEAGGTRFRAWNRLMFSIERVCRDGIRLGMADSDRHDYQLVFVPKGVPEDEFAQRVAERWSIRLDAKTGGEFPNPFCQPAPVNVDENGVKLFDVNFCDGTIAVLWNRTLDVGQALDLYAYTYNPAYSRYEPYGGFGSTVFPLKLPWKGLAGLVVADCAVNDFAVGIAQTGIGTAAPVVTDALVYQASAHDPNWGLDDGLGITDTVMALGSPGGFVTSVRDATAPYCFFGGQGLCGSWGFAEQGYRWPDGRPVIAATYGMTVTANRRDGGSKSVVATIAVQPPPGARPADIPRAATALTAGGSNVCAIHAGGQVTCWGRNREGQLGRVAFPRSVAPLPVAGLPNGSLGVAAGSTHTCSVDTLGGVACWGSNDYGQLGSGDDLPSTAPVAVKGLTGGVAAVVVGNGSSCALHGGAVSCWGNNLYGQLGNGTDDNSREPVRVQGLADASAITSNGTANHACALVAGGAVKCWGLNAYGQLGNGGRNAYIPREVNGLAGATAVSAGQDHTCVLTSARTVKCWGDNRVGQLGNGTTTNPVTPVDVGLTDVVSIRAGAVHTCALTATAGVWCWGHKDALGLAANSRVPVAIPGLSGVQALAAGGNFTCAALAEGVTKCWGRNEDVGVNSATPATVAYLNNYPRAGDDSFTVPAGSTGNVLDVLANDSVGQDVGEVLTLAAVGGTDQGGGAQWNGTAMIYTPAASFAGTERFTYQVDDGNGGTAGATVIVTVTAPPGTKLYLPNVLR
jgi:alpha-tubulin suppressor-like RCC1 family protein